MQNLVYIFILLLGVSSINCHEPIDHEDKWVIADDDQFSFFLQLIYANQRKHCGATLIHWEYALTTAWCFIENTGSGIAIRTLIEALQEQDIINVCSPALTRRGFDPVINSLKKIYVHPKYQCVPEMLGRRCLKYYENDIAIARLKSSMSEYREYVFPIRLPSRSFLSNIGINTCRRGVLVTGRRIKQARNEYDSCDLIRYIGIEPLQERQISVHDTSIRSEKVFYSEVSLEKDHARYGDQGSPYVCYKRFCHKDRPFQYGSLARIKKYRKEEIVISTFEPVKDHIRFIAEYVPLKDFEMVRCGSGVSRKNPTIYFIYLLLIYWIFVYINIL